MLHIVGGQRASHRSNSCVEREAARHWRCHHSGFELNDITGAARGGGDQPVSDSGMLSSFQATEDELKEDTVS